MNKIKTLALYIFIFFITMNVFSQGMHGQKLCNDNNSFLLSIGFETTKEEIISNSQNEFPYNISINIPAVNTQENIDGRKSLILTFSMEDLFIHREFFSNLLSKIKNIEHNCDLIILFVYGENDYKEFDSIKGTNVFLQNIETPDNFTAISFKFNATNKLVIIPGGNSDIAPQWLVTHLITESNKANIQYRLYGNSLGSLFRLNLLKEDDRVSSFIQNEIPCVGVSLAQDFNLEQYANFISSLVSSYTYKDSENWDKHYIIIPISNQIIYFNERFIISAFILISFLSLFIISEFSFFVNKNKSKIKKAVFRLLYILPLTIFITAISFQISQPIANVFSNITGSGLFMQFIIKTIVAFIIATIIYFFQINKQGVFIKQAYAYILTLVSLANVFIFSAVDILLFFLFTSEYIIISMSRQVKKISGLIAVFLLMTIPFIPYITEIINFGNQEVLKKIAYSSFILNILLSFIFLPFLLQWLRIMARVNEKWKKTSLSIVGVRVRNLFLSVSGIIAIIILLAVSGKIISYNTFKNKIAEQDYNEYNIKKIDDNLIMCSISEKTFFGDTSRTIKIDLGEEATFCSVSLQGDNANPIVYSEYQYTADVNTHKDTFAIPTWPPKTMTFSYTANSTPSTITIRAVYKESENNFIERIYTTKIEENIIGDV